MTDHTHTNLSKKMENYDTLVEENEKLKTQLQKVCQILVDYRESQGKFPTVNIKYILDHFDNENLNLKN